MEEENVNKVRCETQQVVERRREKRRIQCEILIRTRLQSASLHARQKKCVRPLQPKLVRRGRVQQAARVVLEGMLTWDVC